MNIYLTLDLEEDLGSAAQSLSYFCHEKSHLFIKMVKESNIKITIFVTGDIIENHFDLLEPYIAEPHFFEFELHSYDHRYVYSSVNKRLENISRSVDAYVKFFSKAPLIFRNPDGVISKLEIELLFKNGIKYGSNFFPAYFPGRFNNLHLPTNPFRIKGLDYIEIPMSVTKLLKIPLSLSYIQLFGNLLYKAILKYGVDESIVFGFHLHDLFTKELFSKGINISLVHKMAYFKAAYLSNGLRLFNEMLNYFKQKNYNFNFLSSYIEDIKKDNIGEISFNELFKQ